MASSINSPPTVDIVCIGFGTKGLALSTILADENPSHNVLVVERNAQFDADLGLAFPDHGMTSTFLRDLITLRNPRSPHTFINFLYEKDLLLDFTNVSQLNTSRRLGSQYMSWVASKIEKLGWVAYGKEVVSIKPRKRQADGEIGEWTIDLRARDSGAGSKIICKRVIIATGSANRLPEALSSPRIASFTLPLSSTSQVLDRIEHSDKPLNIAILGADQEAIELFEYLITSSSKHTASLIFKGSALRAVDTTPFAQELIDGARASNLSLHHLPPELRQKLVSTTVATEFPTIDLHLLEQLYALLYTQTISSPSQGHRFRILPQTVVRHARPHESGVQLDLIDAQTSREKLSAEENSQSSNFDLIVVATERHTLPGSNLLAPLFRDSNLSEQQGSSWTVDRGYQVNFRRNATAPGCGIWVLGTLAGLHTRKTDLSILSATAGRAVDSLMAEAGKEDSGRKGRIEDRGQSAML